VSLWYRFYGPRFSLWCASVPVVGGRQRTVFVQEIHVRNFVVRVSLAVPTVQKQINSPTVKNREICYSSGRGEHVWDGGKKRDSAGETLIEYLVQNMSRKRDIACRVQTRGECERQRTIQYGRLNRLSCVVLPLWVRGLNSRWVYCYIADRRDMRLNRFLSTQLLCPTKDGNLHILSAGTVCSSEY